MAIKAAKTAKKGPKQATQSKKANTPARKYTMSDLPELKTNLISTSASVRKSAAKGIYELSDVSHKKNRTSIVRSGWGIVSNIIECIRMSEGDPRHLALLTLNNLSIPSENKRAFIEEERKDEVMGILVHIIKDDPAESYLACICAMNLSFLESSIPSISSYPGLLPTLTTLLSEGVSAKAGSGKSESVRWAAGLLKNLSRDKEAAIDIAETSILSSLLTTLKNPSSASRWSSNSTEDFALFTILHLSQYESSILVSPAGDVFNKLNVSSILQPIAKSAVGSHSLKASLAMAVLRDTKGSMIPKEAGEDIVKLTKNVLEKKGEEGTYSAGVFKLSTALQALKGVSSKCAVDTFATPVAAALMLQVIASYTLASRESPISNVSPSSDALTVFSKLLPVIANQKIPKTGPTSETPEYSKAVAEITSLVSAYKTIDPSSETLVTSTTQTLSGYTGLRPSVLEAAEIWKEQRERDGVVARFYEGEKGQEVTEDGPLSFLPCNTNECVIL
ncbi:hypothetical protein TrCOL_g4226 [Triparma columacea]|uniref:Uncharacterized protein n=1 Tax=Triparma columacea TaxID=722753 RepID=A0A9W7FZT8_9STRA|nr:hypothetical protein TrCOL_g4226 [Triparma columacea]